MLVLWGLFGACSWTWCIGLYLPVILTRELGWPGFLAMAVPNVAGCVLFGYVGRAGAGRGIEERHHPACRWFSILAVAFNVFFVSYLIGRVGPALPWIGPAAGAGALAVALALGHGPGRAWPLATVAVYVVSLATLLAVGLTPLSSMPGRGTLDTTQILWLAPVVAGGFLLCPHLDLTFYRARRVSGRRVTFLVLGAAFAPMLVLSLCYRDRLDTLALVPFAHIGLQAAFTSAAHLRELRELPGTRARRVGVPVACALLAALLPLVAGRGDGEVVYLRFLVFFGLVFPAYVLLFVGPGPTMTLSRRALAAFAVLMILSLPCFELGFVGRRLWLLVVPAALIIAWKLAIGGARRG